MASKALQKSLDAHALIQSGTPPGRAFEQTGARANTYAYHKRTGRLDGASSSKLPITTLPEAKRQYAKRASKVAVIICSPSDLRGVLNDYL